MTTFQHFDERLTGRCALRRKIANNTYAERRGDDRIAIRLHNTDVVTFDRDGTVTLDTGGWYTMTTKDRMHNFSPLQLFSNRGEWRVTTGYRWGTNVESVGFADGMTWHPERGFAGHLPETDAAIARRERAKINADIKRFIDSITPEQIVHAWNNYGGDCFLCRCDMPDPSCLESHVEERYFHASLAYNAIKARGYFDPNVIMSWVLGAAERGQVDSLLTDNLRKYLRKNLIHGVAVK